MYLGRNTNLYIQLFIHSLIQKVASQTTYFTILC